MTIQHFLKKVFGLFGIEIRLNRNVAKHIAHEKSLVWQRKWELLARQMEIKTVIDVGANTGQFATMINQVFPRARIYSFEPLPDCFSALVENTAYLEQVDCKQVALGREQGVQLFKQTGFSPCSSFLEPTELLTDQIPAAEQVTELEVQIDTLDHQFSERSLDSKVLLKLDVQGFEKEVLLGAAETLKKVDVVVAEVAFAVQYEGQPLFDELNALLRDCGFKYQGNVDQHLCTQTSQIIEADAIFVKA